MIHHFKPAVTSIAATPIGRPEYIDDIKRLLDMVTPGDAHAPNFHVEPDGSVIITSLENDPIRYGSRSDPSQWWLLIDSKAVVWFTTESPYDNPDLVSSGQAR